MKYRREIDGLRALAVLPVILFHAGFETFRGGFVGVDVFFVISGYLITTILLTELEQGNFSIVNFYERRARRILPVLFVVMLACIPFAWFWLLPNDMKAFSKSLIAVSLFSSNFLFLRESGYFDTASELKPLLHTWSLAVEEQYYLLFPLFLMFAWRLGRRWILIILAAAFFGSLGLAQWASIAKPSAAFYLLPTRGWEMLIGAFAAFYLSKENHTEFSKSVSEIGGWLGLSLIGYSIFTYNQTTPFPGVYALVPTIGTVLIIFFATQHTAVGKFVGNKAFVGVGLISYSAYLWHQPIFAFANIYTINQISLYLKAYLIILIAALSVLSTIYIETPFRKFNKLNRKLVLKICISVFFIFVVFGVCGYIKNGFPDRFSKEVSIMTKAIKDWGHPGNLVKSNTLGFYKFDNSKPIDVLFFGDSHAEHFAPLSLDFAKSGKNVGFLSGGGCPPIPNLLDDKHPHCFDLFNRLEQILSAETEIKTIFIAGCFNCYFIKETSSKPNAESVFNYYLLRGGEKLYFRSKKGQNEALENFKLFLQRISLKGKLVVIGDNPQHYSFDPNLIALYITRGQSVFFKSRYSDFSKSEFTVQNEQIELNKKIRYFTPFQLTFVDSINIVCPKLKCNQLDNKGNPLYRDSHHMRPEFVRKAFRSILLNAVLY